MALLAVLAGLLVPGFGAALAGRRREAVAWALVVPGLWLAVVVAPPWLFYLSFAVRVVGAVRGGWLVRGAAAVRWLAVVPIVVAAVALIVVVRTLLHNGVTHSGSMYPTIAVGDRFFVASHPIAIERGDVITFAGPCDREVEYVKRVIARGGDSVEVRCGVVFVNGVALPATAVPGPCTYREPDDAGIWTTHACTRTHESHGDHAYDVFGSPTREDGDATDFPNRLRAVASCERDAIAKALVETNRAAAVCEPQLKYVVPADSYFVMGDNRNISRDSRVFGAVPAALVTGKVRSIWMSVDEHGDVAWSRIGSLP